MKKEYYSWMVVGVLAATVLLFSTPLAYGQAAAFARLVGTVSDQTGAVIPGVELTAVNKRTNVVKLTITDERGNYILDKLIASTYDVSAELPGFKKQVSVDVILEVEQVGRLDFVLTPGQIAEQVTVTGQTPVIQTETAELAAVISEKKVMDLPLSGRNITKLAYLTTGGTQERQNVTNEYLYAYGGNLPAFNGLYSHSNSVMMDGSNNLSMMTSRMNAIPSPETVQEFKVVTTSYSAEYGRVGGAVISMLTKSGSNEMHGDAWYYFRDEGFDANTFFNNRRGREKLPLDYKIFGARVGGPIFKDRTFYHGSWERFVDDFSQPAFSWVPTSAQRGGNFGAGEGPHGTTGIFDPFNVVDGQRVPFPNGVIPQNRRHPIYNNFINILPPPAPNTSHASGNFTYDSSRFSRINKYSARVDHHFVGDDTIFGRWSWQNTPTTSHRNNIGTPDMLGGVYQRFEDRSHGWSTAWGWVNPIGSNLVTELNVSVWKFSWLIARSVDKVNWAEQLGFDLGPLYVLEYPDGSRGPGGMPTARMDGYMGYGGGLDAPLADTGIGAKYSASWRKGNHYLKMGFEQVRNIDVNFRWTAQCGDCVNTMDGFATGQITRDETGEINGATFGDPWADFMLGAASFAQGNHLGLGTSSGHFNQSHYNAFVQDDWKVSQHLTLNLGVRWEQPRPAFYEGSPDGSFENDYYYCGIDYSGGRFDPVQTAPQDFDIPLWAGDGLAVPFRNLDRHGCYKPKWRYFAPRVGLAWRFLGSNKTVLRFGAALGYDQEFGILRARRMLPAIGNVRVIQDRGEAPSIQLGTFLDQPSSVITSEYHTCYFSELDWEEGQVYSFNLGIQHEIFPGTKLELGYVGNQGRHIREISPHNIAQPEGRTVPLQDGTPFTASSDEITYTRAQTGPQFGALSELTWSGQRARRPYPQIVPNTLLKPHGNMYYNSLQAKLERRFQDGVAVTAGWTWSKAMALNFAGIWGDWAGSRPYERHAMKGPMTHDRTHAFYNSNIWELPFFRNTDGMTRTILGGWEVTSILTIQTGAISRLRVGRDVHDLGQRRATYPDRIGEGNLPESERTVDRFFNLDHFVVPCVERTPDDPRGVDGAKILGCTGNGDSAVRPIRSDGVPIMDFSFHKQFAISEEKTFTFRVDMFNAFNHPVFNFPQQLIDRSNSATVTGTALPRQIQFGMRFSF